MESRNTSEEDLVVSVVEHDITSHKEGDTTDEIAGLGFLQSFSTECIGLILLCHAFPS